MPRLPEDILTYQGLNASAVETLTTRPALGTFHAGGSLANQLPCILLFNALNVLLPWRPTVLTIGLTCSSAQQKSILKSAQCMASCQGLYSSS